MFRLVSVGLESDLTPRAVSFVHAAAAAAAATATEVDTGQAVPVSTLTYRHLTFAASLFLGNLSS